MSEATLTPEERLTESDTALRLGISVWSLRRLERAGEITAFRPSPRRIFYLRGDLDEFVRRRRTRPRVGQAEPAPPAAA